MRIYFLYAFPGCIFTAFDSIWDNRTKKRLRNGSDDYRVKEARSV